MRINVISRRLPLLVCALALLLPPAGSTQAGGDGGVEHHYWIVLLDVSASFEGREAASSAGAAGLPTDYRLRNEVLSLIHTMLAARNRAEGGRRLDHLSVYFFGRGVYPVIGAQMDPVQWDLKRNEGFWNEQQLRLTARDRERTDLRAALDRAYDDFRNDIATEWKKHLVVISDGELDVDPQGRNPGDPPEREEIDVYENLLNTNNRTVSWLRENDVTLHALAVDEDWQGGDDLLRRSILADLLYDERRGGGEPLAGARTLIQERASGVGVQSFRSEGPLVLLALVEGAGNHQSQWRSVRHDNLYDVLWSTFFPGAEGPYVAPGTRTVLLLSHVDEPVAFRMDGAAQPVRLEYDDARDTAVVVDGPGHLITRMDAQRSAQFVTWVVESTHITEVIAGPQARVESVNDVDLRWRPARPPQTTARGQVVPLTAELVWHRESAVDDLATWQARMREILNDITTVVRISAPNSRTPVQITLQPSLVANSDSVLLVLEGEYSGTQAEGMHALSGTMSVTTPGRQWQETLPDTRIEVSARPPAPPRLFVAPQVGERRGEREDVTAGAAATELSVRTRGSVLLHFTVEPGAEALPDAGALPAPEAVPNHLLLVGPDGEIARVEPVRAEAVAGGNRYEFSPLALPPGALGDSLAVRVVAGPNTYDYRLRVHRQGGIPWWVWGIAALLVAAIVLWAFGPRGPRLDFVAVIRGRAHPPRGRALVVARVGGQVRVQRRAGRNADAVRFTAEPGRIYRLTPAGPRSEWTYRRVNPEMGGNPDFETLGPSGHTLHRDDFLENWRYEVRNGDWIVEIRMQSQASLPREEVTHTGPGEPY